MEKLIKIYRKMPSLINRAKLAKYLGQHPMAVCLATSEQIEFLRCHGFID